MIVEKSGVVMTWVETQGLAVALLVVGLVGGWILLHRTVIPVVRELVSGHLSAVRTLSDAMASLLGMASRAETEHGEARREHHELLVALKEQGQRLERLTQAVEKQTTTMQSRFEQIELESRIAREAAQRKAV